MRARRMLVAVAGLAAAVWLGRATLDAMERAREARELAALRDSLAGLRAQVVECQGDFGREDARFRAFDERVDSLRADVRAFEALDERGVPAARYDEYLQGVAAYNDSVAAWKERAEELRRLDERCRALIRRHNTLRDTIEGRLEGRPAAGGGERLGTPPPRR